MLPSVANMMFVGNIAVQNVMYLALIRIPYI